MIGRRSLLIIVSTVLSSSLGFIGLFAMTNYLGKDVYGNIAWVMATIGTLNVVADLGFGNAHIKRISEGRDENDCVSTYIVIKLVMTAFMVLFVFVVLLLWINILGGHISPSDWNLVMLFVLYYILYDVASIATLTFIARMETTKAELVALMDPLIRVPLIMFVAINHLSIINLAYAFVFSALGVLLAGTFL